MKGFIQLTNVYQSAPTLVNVRNICYFYKQDVGMKHTVIFFAGGDTALSVEEEFDKVKEMIEAATSN